MNRKMLVSLFFVVTMLLLAVAPTVAQEPPGITIADLIATAARSSAPEFTSLYTALLASDPAVLATLDNPNTIVTFFAPTDAAFKELRSSRYGAAAFTLLSRDQGTLTKTMLYHMVPGYFLTSNIQDKMRDASDHSVALPTYLGQFLDFTPTADDSGYLIDGEAKPLIEGMAVTIAGEGQTLTVAGSDIQAINGVIHVIDHVLIPTVDSVAVVLKENNFNPDATFDTFLSLVAAANHSVSDQLFNANSDITVLVPTDAAFAVFAMPVATMLADINRTSDVLAYHILPGRTSTIDIRSRIATSSDGQAIINTSLGGLFRRTAVAFTVDDSGTLVVNGGAHVIQQNVDAGSSIIHVIDAVLSPP